MVHGRNARVDRKRAHAVDKPSTALLPQRHPRLHTQGQRPHREDCDQIVGRLKVLTKGLFRETLIIEASAMHGGAGHVESTARKAETERLRALSHSAPMRSSRGGSRRRASSSAAWPASPSTSSGRRQSAPRRCTCLRTGSAARRLSLTNCPKAAHAQKHRRGASLRQCRVLRRSSALASSRAGPSPHSSSHALVAPMTWPAPACSGHPLDQGVGL